MHTTKDEIGGASTPTCGDVFGTRACLPPRYQFYFQERRYTMKLVVFGGGSAYTPELIQGLIDNYEALPFTEVCLMDINTGRLEILAGLTQRMLARAGLPVVVTATTERREALQGATFVNGLIRVGGMDARINDERIPLKHGIIGQETTGPGGMMKALRTIPVMLDLAKDMLELCPQAWLINYTNPSGIIAEALGKYSQVRFVGLCSGPDAWMARILRLMDVQPDRANVDWLGLNHLGFAIRIWVDGQDRTAQAVEAVAAHWNIDAEWLRTLGAIPASYLSYFYHHTRLVEQAQKPGYRTRGEQVKEMEAELLRQYADPNLDTKPDLLTKRGGGGYAELAFSTMRAISHNTGERRIVQVLNEGAIDGLPDDASVEVSCVLDRTGAHPIRMGEMPLPIRGLIQAVKAYESLTVQAAVEGSSRLALQALMAHPMVPSWEVARPLWADLLAANQPWLPWTA
jgi:6-phospho-beta-glucosidase